MINTVVEQDVIGTLCILTESCPAMDEAFDNLGPEHFNGDNRDAFLALKAAYVKYARTDLSALASVDAKHLIGYISDLSRNSTPSGLGRNIRQLKADLKVRQLHNLSNKMNQILAGRGSAADKLEQAQAMIASADTDFGDSRRSKHIKDVSIKWLEHIENMYENRDKYICPTGIPDLDRLYLGGFNTTDLVVIGARPKMGKTELLCRLVEYQGFDRQVAVYVASLEMTDMQNVERIITNRSRVQRSSIRLGISSDEAAKLHDTIADAAKAPIYLDDRSNIGLAEIRSEARAIKAEHGHIGMIAVDYLTLMKVSGGHSRHDLAVGEISRGLKSLAKELNCPVVLLSQLSRDVEKRPDKRPMNSDLRESGSVEQDADRVIMIYCEGVYSSKFEMGNVRELITTANRHGDTGTVHQAMTGHGFMDIPEEDAIRYQMLIEGGSGDGDKSTKNF